MTTTNPLLKATRAAFTELTTSEAQAWYRTTAKATAAGAIAIAHKSIATVICLLKPQSVAEPQQAIAPYHPESAFAEAVELEQWPIPNGWDVIEADNKPALDSVDELDDFQKIIDSHRPMGQKVFSASESDINHP